MFRAQIRAKLYLRLLEERHAPKVFSLVDQDRAYLREWLPWVDATQTVDDTLSFIRSSLESTLLSDLWSGIAKTPVFGFLIAIIGCHFGLRTTGGTEGVGTSTTRTVVVVSISILVADFMRSMKRMPLR